MISASDLASIQAAAATLLDTACTVTRNTSTAATVYGARQSSITTIYSGQCSMAKPTAGQMQAYANVVGNLVTWIIKLPYGTAVERGDTITIGTDVLTVQAVLNPHSLAALTLLLATEVR